MTRVLPGVYVEFHDYSMLPEGETNLAVGYVLASPRGPVGKAELVTSPADFLSKFTLTGSPTIKDDKTFWSILQVLKYTNEVYVSRAARDVKFGGVQVKANATEAFTQGVENVTDWAIDETYPDALFVLTGIDGGKYNNDIGIEIVSYKDQPYTIKDQFESEKAMNEAQPFIIRVYDCTNPSEPALLEEFMVSLLDNAKSFDGSPLYIETVLAGSAYIRVTMPQSRKNNAPASTVKATLTSTASAQIVLGNIGSDPIPMKWTFNGTKWESDEATPKQYTEDDFKEHVVNYTGTANKGDVVRTAFDHVQMAGGDNADFNNLTQFDAIKALEVFEDKTVPISLFGNGTGLIYENTDYQQAVVELSRNRQDFLAFLNSREKDEKATYNSVKASNIIKYKKGANDAAEDNLGSTYWGACMYAPHVNYSDVFNSRKIKLGVDSTAISGWLGVLLNQGYPYAYAGPQDGLVSGVTCDWKIGDLSGEATQLNDASINYVAYDAKVGRYYMQCQNTLQIANSSLRNIGAVLNILDIKKTFITYFKEYLQKPITPRLREELWNKGNDYLKDRILGMNRCVNYSFVDATTDLDLADNTLKFILTIALTPYAQKIYLYMNIVNANYDFSIVQGN